MKVNKFEQLKESNKPYYKKKFNAKSLKKFASDKEALYDLIKEYSALNDLYYFKRGQDINNFYYENNVDVIGDEVMVITVIDYTTEQLIVPYMIKDINDLNRYIESPDSYDKSNKYNL